MLAHVVVRCGTLQGKHITFQPQWSYAVSSMLRVLSNEATNHLQILVSAMELGETSVALNACKCIHEVIDRMRLDIMGMNLKREDLKLPRCQ